MQFAFKVFQPMIPPRTHEVTLHQSQNPKQKNFTHLPRAQPHALNRLFDLKYNHQLKLSHSKKTPAHQPTCALSNEKSMHTDHLANKVQHKKNQDNYKLLISKKVKNQFFNKSLH